MRIHVRRGMSKSVQDETGTCVYVHVCKEMSRSVQDETGTCVYVHVCKEMSRSVHDQVRPYKHVGPHVVIKLKIYEGGGACIF